MSEPPLFDPIDEGRRRRDEGAQLAADSVHTHWRVAAEVALERLAAADRPFIAAARRGLIEPVAYRQSNRTEARGRAVRVWMGTRHQPSQEASNHPPAPPPPAARQPAPPPAPPPPAARQPAPPPAPPPPAARQPAPPPAPPGQWSAADVPAPCVACGQPAFMRNPAGQPRHRVECTGRRP